MYSYVFDTRVTSVDVRRLASFFPEKEAFDEMCRRLENALARICRNPTVGGPLTAQLSNWCKLPWESGPVPNWDPWPDMRLVYRLQEGRVKVFAVGKRHPGYPDDVYAIATERSLAHE